MRLVTLFVCAVISVSSALAGNQPNVPPPAEWRGVKFNMKRTEAEKIIKSSFTNVKRSGSLTTLANTTVGGHPVVVQFLFGDSSNKLCHVVYHSEDLSLDTTMKVLSERYGEPTTDSTFSGQGMSFRFVRWMWEIPPFDVTIMHTQGGVTVNYSCRFFLESRSQEKPKEQASPDEY